MAQKKAKAESIDYEPIQDEYCYQSRGEQCIEMVNFIRSESNKKYTMAQLASYFGCSTQSLRNKFSRGSFSFSDFMLLLYLHGFYIKVMRGDETIDDYDPSTYVHNDKEMWTNYLNARRQTLADIEQKIAELKKQQSELDE